MDYMKKRIKEIEEILKRNEGSMGSLHVQNLHDELKDLKRWTRPVPKMPAHEEYLED